MIYSNNSKDLNSAVVRIENIQNEKPYTSIGSKVFLSCKNICEIILPETITSIGDWAFAHMKELKKITLPARRISFGKEVFLDCANLEEIVIYPDETECKGLSYLLASCIRVLNNIELLDFETAVKDNESWCKSYDSVLCSFINAPDENGFKFYIVGWFDDDSEEEQLLQHIKKTKEEKIKICFLRLKYDKYCDDDIKRELASYVRKQFELKDIDNNAWELFSEELSDDVQIVEAAVKNNIISEDLKLELINCINNRNGNPETVSYLLSLKDEKKNLDNLFEL